MSSSVPLPSPDDDYTAHDNSSLTLAFWNAALNSAGRRIRALEAVKADWEELIAVGTGQALEVISANVEPQLAALTALINTLKADVAAAEDAIATIVAGGINMANVLGLSSALALKANVAYVDAAIDALKGGAPEAYDTLVEIANKLANDDSAIAALLTTIAAKADKSIQIKVGKGFSIDGVAGSEEAPAVGDLSTSRLLRLSVLPETKASKRNRHLNPAFQVCQDRGTGATAVFAGGSAYSFDGVSVTAVGGGALTCQQLLKVSPGGSPYRFRGVASTADASLASDDIYAISLPIEGCDVADLMFGTANAKSFVWRGVVTLPAGTYGLSFCNAAGTRSYVVMFTIAAGAADTLVTAVVPGDISGTWVTDSSGTGIQARICLASGTNWQTATPGAWTAGNLLTTSAQTNGMAVVNNLIELSDIGLYEGTELPAWERPDFSDDLRKCQRYYQAFTVSLRGYAGFGGEELGVGFAYPVVMRAYPASLGLGSGAHGNVSNFDLQGMTQNSARLRVFAAASGDVSVLDKLAVLSARL